MLYLHEVTEWSQRDSNSRPSACHADALPTAPWPQPARLCPDKTGHATPCGPTPIAGRRRAEPTDHPTDSAGPRSLVVLPSSKDSPTLGRNGPSDRAVLESRRTKSKQWLPERILLCYDRRKWSQGNSVRLRAVLVPPARGSQTDLADRPFVAMAHKVVPRLESLSAIPCP